MSNWRRQLATVSAYFNDSSQMINSGLPKKGSFKNLYDFFDRSLRDQTAAIRMPPGWPKNMRLGFCMSADLVSRAVKDCPYC